MLKLGLSVCCRARDFRRDARGMAAVEFAMILPMMLMILFGTIQVSTGVAVDRKVTVLTRTISDLISQASSITDTDISNSFAMGAAIMTPYSSTPMKAKISQIYIDPTTLVAKVKWSKATNTSAHACNEVVTVPTGLAIGGTYLIMSEVNYDFQPVVGFNINLGFASPVFPFSETTYTRPRQTSQVNYPTAPTCT